MTNTFLDNYTVEDIIEQSMQFKNEAAGRKWAERVLKEKAEREEELKALAEQRKKNEEYRRFSIKESKEERINRTDKQKMHTCKLMATKHDLDLDELIKIQKDACDEYNRNHEPEEEIVIDFGFEEMVR